MCMHYACIHICVCIHTHTHTHTHSACTRTRTRTRTHTHTQHHPRRTTKKKVSTHTNLLDDRSISAGGREHELPSIQLAAIHLVCQFPAARVNEILRHGRVEGLGEFLGEIFAEYVVARRCEAI